MSVLPTLGAWCGWLAGTPAAAARDAVMRLESAGFGAVWVSEALGREVLSHAALLLCWTRRMTVATGIASIWARDPMAAVNGARSLAEASGGRFVLGIGVSHAPLVGTRGQHYDAPVARLERYLAQMRDARYAGPPPAGEPPVLVGALGERMLALARDAADGAHPYLVTPEHTARARALLGDHPVLAPEQAVVLHREPQAAREAARRHLATYLRLDNYRRSLLRQGFASGDLDGGGSDRLVDALVAHGDEEAIAARVAAHLDAGADHVAVQALEVDGGLERVEQLVRLRPALASRATGPGQKR